MKYHLIIYFQLRKAALRITDMWKYWFVSLFLNASVYAVIHILFFWWWTINIQYIVTSTLYVDERRSSEHQVPAGSNTARQSTYSDCWSPLWRQSSNLSACSRITALESYWAWWTLILFPPFLYHSLQNFGLCLLPHSCACRLSNFKMYRRLCADVFKFVLLCVLKEEKLSFSINSGTNSRLT